MKIEEESCKKKELLKNKNAKSKIIRPHCGGFVNFFAWMKKDATYLTNVNFLCVLHLTMVIMLLKTQA